MRAAHDSVRVRGRPRPVKATASAVGSGRSGPRRSWTAAGSRAGRCCPRPGRGGASPEGRYAPVQPGRRRHRQFRSWRTRGRAGRLSWAWTTSIPGAGDGKGHMRLFACLPGICAHRGADGGPGRSTPTGVPQKSRYRPPLRCRQRGGMLPRAAAFGTPDRARDQTAGRRHPLARARTAGGMGAVSGRPVRRGLPGRGGPAVEGSGQRAGLTRILTPRGG